MNDYKIIHTKINNKSGLSQIFDVVYGDGALNIKQSDAMTLIDSLDSGVIPVFRFIELEGNHVVNNYLYPCSIHVVRNSDESLGDVAFEITTYTTDASNPVIDTIQIMPDATLFPPTPGGGNPGPRLL